MNLLSYFFATAVEFPNSEPSIDLTNVLFAFSIISKQAAAPNGILFKDVEILSLQII